MGCSCTKNQKDKIVKGNKLSEIKSTLVKVGKKTEENKTTWSTVKLKRNMFYKIQKKSWANILDFMTYKDLTRAGCLNKALNKIAKSQSILKKFYKNRSGNTIVENAHQIVSHNHLENTNNYTTINNFNNFHLSKESEVSPNEEKPFKCLISLPTLTVEYDKQSDLKGSFASLKASHYDTKSIDGFKKLQLQLTNPYVDMFSNKEIEFKLDNGVKSDSNDSFDYKRNSNRKFSSDNRSDQTPSFSLECENEIVEIIRITNITQYNIPKKKSSRSVYNKNSHTLKIPKLAFRVKSAEKIKNPR